MRLFFFGLGFSSLATARSIRGEPGASVPIAGTVRSPTADDEGIAAHVFTGEAPGPTLAGDLMQATHVIGSIPPGEAGDPALIHHAETLDRAGDLQWLGYFSTVGVYGDFGGAWIDETAPCQPHNPRSLQRLAAERQWQNYAERRGVPLAIFRLAGIYGPGRSAFDRLRDGTARRMVKPGQVFNRIHVADIGRITRLAAERKLAGVYNLADDEPAPPQDLVSFAAGLMGIEPPPETVFQSAELSPMARSFYADNKRVRNTAIKAALGIDLLYPNYCRGLTAIFKDSTT